MELREAFTRLSTDRALAERFVEDPEGVLRIMGLDTSKLVIQPIISDKEPFKAAEVLRRAGPQALPIVVNICASVGFFVCASVGTDVDTDDIFGAVDLPVART